jgi:dCMP deaminase
VKNGDLYFMRLASVAATEATCPRKHVGAVIVRNRRSVSTGYNGSLPKQPHCEDVGCMMEDGHCVRTIHSEANAILQAARLGAPIEGATIYVTASPCWPCFKLIVGAGLKRVVYGELYRDERITQFAKECGIELTDMTPPSRCGECNSCWIEQHGCGCDGACDFGCFNCTPTSHTRPPCPEEMLAKARAAEAWQVKF